MGNVRGLEGPSPTKIQEGKTVTLRADMGVGYCAIVIVVVIVVALVHRCGQQIAPRSWMLTETRRRSLQKMKPITRIIIKDAAPNSKTRETPCYTPPTTRPPQQQDPGSSPRCLEGNGGDEQKIIIKII